MIKFFRIIRKNSIKENKIIDYFKYALGEIVLVVLGILIALSINNWNSKRLDNLRAERFNHNLKIQLKNNLADVDFYIEENTFNYDKSKDLIKIIGNKNKKPDDSKIDSLIFLNSGDFHLNLDINIITEARENGDLELLPSESLRQSIYYLSNLYNEILERERITNANLNNRFLPYLTKNYNIKNLVYSLSFDKDLEKSKVYKGDNYKMLANQEFENLITNRLINTKELLDLYIELKEEIEKTTVLVELKN